MPRSAAGHRETGSVTTVLVLSAGGFQGLGIARLLASVSGVRIVIADSEAMPLTGLLADDVVRLPLVADRDRFLTALRSCCVERGVQLVVPATEIELEPLSREAAGLERELDLRVAVCPPEVLRDFGDRASLGPELDKIDIPHPPRFCLANLTEEDLPVLGKPRSSWGGRGQRVLRSADDLERARQGTDPDLIWTPLYDDFREISADFAIGFSGQTSRPVLRERIRTTGGFCVVAAEYRAEGVDGHVRRLAATLAQRGGRGLFNVQFLLTESSTLLSDLNLRFGTSGVFPLGLAENPMEVLLEDLRPATDRPKSGADGPGGAPCRPVRMYRTLEETYLPDEAGSGFEPVRAVLFDLDDTLIDQKSWILSKLEAVWDSQTLPLPDRGTFLRAGWRALEEHRQAVLLDAMIESLKLDADSREPLIEAYRSVVPEKCPIYPDARGCLMSLRQQGFKVGLVTDNPPRSQRKKLEVGCLTPAFDEVVFTRDEGQEKPGTAGILTACRKLGTAPGDTVFVGDNPLKDGLGALASGLRRFYWVRRSGGFWNASETLLRRLAPDLWAVTTPISDLRQLREALRPR